VPALKGLTYQDGEKRLHAANLNIRLLATRHDYRSNSRTWGGSSSRLFSWRYRYQEGSRWPRSIKFKAHELHQISHTLRSGVSSLPVSR
jgi:hypothetical protein